MGKGRGRRGDDLFRLGWSLLLWLELSMMKIGGDEIGSAFDSFYHRFLSCCFSCLLFLGMDALHEVKDGAGLDGDFTRAYSTMNELRLNRRGRIGMDKIK